MVKNFRSIATQLDDDQYGKLIQICKEQGCTPYYVIKDLLQQYIEIYEWAVKEELEKERNETRQEEEAEDHANTGQTESEDLELEQTDNSSNNNATVIRIRG